MADNANVAQQTGAVVAKNTDNIMQDIQDMIGNLLKSTVDKMQRSEVGEQMGDEHPKDSAESDAMADMGIADLKNFVLVMQKFIDNVNVMVAQIESGVSEPKAKEEKFLDSYMATADNVLEIAAFSMKDSLTGLSNRYGFDSRLILEWNRASRDKSPLGLVIFSVVGFTGRREDVYKAISKKLLKSIKRSTDFIARWDNDEFAALLPTTDGSGVKIVAERILAELESTQGIDTQGGKLSVPIGVCVHIPESSEKPADFIAKAHGAFEKAKASEKSIIVYDEIE